MARRLLRNDNLLQRGREATRAKARGAFAFVLGLVCVGLLLLSWFDHSGVREARWRLAEALTPALSALLSPLAGVRSLGRDISDFAGSKEELQRLREENQRLKGWEWRAHELERRLADVGAIARTLPEQPIPFVTARIVAHSSGPFVRSGLIDAGRKQGLKSGFPVMTADGLVGRLVETGEAYARVLLVTDLNSRIPVLVGRQGTRAMLIGDNSAWPRLDFLGEPARVEAGDDVATSGVGGLFPRGLRIGRVIAEGDRPRVSPLGRIDDLNYVSVLIYDSPDRLLDGEDKKQKPRPANAKGNRGS